MNAPTDLRTAPAEIVSDSTGTPHLRESLRELLLYREVVWSFGVRRIRTRYKQAAFGMAWAVVQPVAFLVIFVFFIGRTLGGDHPGSYAASSFAALVGWQFVSSAVQAAGSSLTSEAHLLRKVYFPRESPTLGAVGSFLPDLGINLVALVIATPILDGHFSLAWFAVPLLLAQLVVLSLAVGLPLAALAVHYRDFLYALPVMVQLWLFTSPVAYSIDQIDDKWHNLYAALNPAVGPIDGLRRIVGQGESPDWMLVSISGVVTLVVLAGGYRLFKSLERAFSDVV